MFRRLCWRKVFYSRPIHKSKIQGFHNSHQAHTLEHFTGDINAIKDTSMSLLKEFLDGKKIRLISIRLSNLEKVKARQKSMEEFLLA
jgi:nucleotidyltransferase/DNA polymerase involved in DNA repair